MFVCRTGNALIDHRAYFRPAAPGDLPTALFFQTKDSKLETSNGGITSKSLLSWHKKCSDALVKVAIQFRVCLVLVTNRKVALPDINDWPENLLVISRDELATYLGSLAHRGLLAVSS